MGQDKIRGFEFVSRLEDTKDLKLPERSTELSAGYDFFAIEDVVIPYSIDTTTYFNPTLVKTGIKSYMQPDEVLKLYIRSSSPMKKGLVMANSVGIIDADYYNNEDNEGEIAFMVYNFSGRDVFIEKWEKIGQGIFEKYYLADNDNAKGKRTGGIGSTGV